MRGTRGPGPGEGPGCRIIPADAGNTKTFIRLSPDGRDHPRGCGEHFSVVESMVVLGGSSPRMRGTLELIIDGGDDRRIIPADAGNTTRPMGRGLSPADHPRGCGEHTIVQRCYRHMMRIIPADAGNTLSIPTKPVRCGDHPRGCGEHGIRRQILLGVAGSSPRMRGTHSLTSGHLLTRRIIPADAGNTSLPLRHTYE